MVYFPNVDIELWDYTESTTEFNPYYEPLKEYSLTNTVPGNFQPMSPNEILKEFGEILTDTYKIIIDSLVYHDGSYVVEESNWILNIIRHRNIDGVLQYTIFEGDKIAQMYEVGQKKEKLYESDGSLHPMYREVRGDTAFWNLNYRAPGCGFGLNLDDD